MTWARLAMSVSPIQICKEAEKETGPMCRTDLSSVLFLGCFRFRGTPLLGVAFGAFLGLFEAV